MVAPQRALREIERKEGGGFWVLIAWSLLAALGLRFANLADAVVGFEAGGGLRVVSVLVGELSQAIPVALVAALAVVVAAGTKRDPSVDLELGCAATIPFLFVRAVFRTAVIVVGREPSLGLVQVSYILAVAWTVLAVLLAIRIARGRPHARGADAMARLHPWALTTGWGALVVLAVALGGSAIWTVRNAATLGPVTRGTTAADFSLPRVDGQPGSLSLSSYRGRVVVLDFWATWCPPCLAALPMMHDLSHEVESKGVTFVGVDSDGSQTSPTEVTEFLRQHGAPYPVVYDDGTAGERYRIKVLPTVVIVGKDGVVERVFIGSTGRNALAAAIDVARAR